MVGVKLFRFNLLRLSFVRKDLLQTAFGLRFNILLAHGEEEFEWVHVIALFKPYIKLFIWQMSAYYSVQREGKTPRYYSRSFTTSERVSFNSNLAQFS